MGALTVSNLSKVYKRYPSKWARAREWSTGKTTHEKTWVLRDINFTIQPGEAVGVIGMNGAGKSTLLKIITGTTQPTTGSVQIQGRIAALLELGMGFHPDFTGRQNVFMAGQLLGLSAEEIARCMPDIEAFADIGDYIERPVRMYSSGMQMRLAFSVASAVRPDVLIVDEALSVGDAAFQRKCFQRLESYRSAGTTLLFVSHDIETVKKLCDTALFIKEGQLAQWGQANQVCDSYERYLFGGGQPAKSDTRANEIRPVKGSTLFDPSLIASCEMTYGNGKAEIEACWLCDETGQQVNVIESGTAFRWCYRVRFNQDANKPIFAMMLKTREGVALYGVDSQQLPSESRGFRAGETVQVEFTLANPLAPGVYYLNCGVRDDGTDGIEFLSRRVDAALLKVIHSSETSVVTGLVEMKANLSVSSSLLKASV
mgnify:CR=1 FL=1